MNGTVKTLGIDIGAVSVSVVGLDECGDVAFEAYEIHKGAFRGVLDRLLSKPSLAPIERVGLTGISQGIVKIGKYYDSTVAFITASKKLHPGASALLAIGGERFSLSFFGADGGYGGGRFNTPCAAGTGSFLDQQAVRLGLESGAQIGIAAMSEAGEPPRIASRCSVFAKTDLIHAQQQGHSLGAICKGLCRGLAANVVDTLFGGREAPPGEIVFAGGVAKNGAVKHDIEKLIGHTLVTDRYAGVYGALGAALLASGDDSARVSPMAGSPGILLAASGTGVQYFYPPLNLELSDYPDFSSSERFIFSPEIARGAGGVEVDIYRKPAPGTAVKALLGIDIGSTSTKAVLLLGSGEENPGGTLDDRVIAGFYTRTAGRPVDAVQALFEAIDRWAADASISLEITGAGTTGSGRKFIGGIVGADLIADEITAHARAASRIDPEVDTIIEIGGQDAKFTTLKNGAVTCSIMNNVCAAGTGSFIEEQAQRLMCRLEDLSDRAAGRRAPLASDRCTVFMERDINHYLGAGCPVDDVLAAVLHSVRENYLRKVAREPLIGDRIVFQGATARNRSLVAAFEQKLGRPIRVSRFCHLTGAIGIALMLGESAVKGSAFRGIGIFRERIPVSSEVCIICRNHCKLSVASVGGEAVAFGMLCGRDYRDERFVPSNTSGFDLSKSVRDHFRSGPKKEATAAGRIEKTVGIPAGLYLYEEMALWKSFFDLLGVRTVTSEGLKNPVTLGKRLAGAEFCAPIAAFHAHARSLADRADFVFIPLYMEEGSRPPGTRRNYCYYTQWAGSLAWTIPDAGMRKKLLMPVVENCGSLPQKILSLYRSLRPALGPGITLPAVSRAFHLAGKHYRERAAALPGIMESALRGDKGISVVLMGRPYTVLSPAMNGSIPGIIGALGVKAFWQGMVKVEDRDRERIGPLLTDVHWAYAARTLACAEAVGRTEGLYPVLVTSFKCAPDSIISESFRRIFDSHGKPCLILQLDEHDSQAGYETRLEAAIRTFRSHAEGRTLKPKRMFPVNPERAPSMEGKTVLLPCWDRYAGTLMAASFRREGVDARVLEEDEVLITRAMRHNTGQCIPLNIIVEEAASYIERHALDPAKSVIWIHSSQLGCNIGAFPLGMEMLMQARGGGFEKTKVYVGQMTGKDVSVRAILNQYLVFICAGYLRKAGTAIRPYEIVPGETDRVLEECLATFEVAFESGRPILPVVKSAVDRLLAIKRTPGGRPKVAVFGDLYVRDNDVLSQNLIKAIEGSGGEALTTPYSEYTKLISGAYLAKWVREGKYAQAAGSKAALETVKVLERRFVREFERVCGPAPGINRRFPMAKILEKYGVTTRHTGESLDNLLKIHHLLETHPDIALFVQMSPAFCCPSLVTEAMAADIKRVTGIPVVTIIYDGTRSPKNDVLAPHLRFLGKANR